MEPPMVKGYAHRGLCGAVFARGVTVPDCAFPEHTFAGGRLDAAPRIHVCYRLAITTIIDKDRRASSRGSARQRRPLVQQTHHTPEVPRGDRVAIWAFVVAGAAIVVFTAVQAVARVMAVLSQGPHEVFVALPPEATVSVEVGTGKMLALTEASGTIRVDTLPAPALIPGVAGPILAAVTTIVVTACLLALAASILRGSIFSRRNTALVVTAGITGLIGYSLANLASTMLANEAVRSAAGENLATTVFAADPLVYLLTAFTVAVVATAFAVGARLQRETEGLV